MALVLYEVPYFKVFIFCEQVSLWHYWRRRAPLQLKCMKIEDKEASIGEIAVEFEQDLVGGAVCCLEGSVSTEDPELR